MKATFQRQYRKRETGNLVFVYTVSGTPEELASYKALKGVHYKENEQKAPLFFTSRYAGEVTPLRMTSDKLNWVADTTEQDKIKSMVDQFGKGAAEIILNKNIEGTNL